MADFLTPYPSARRETERPHFQMGLFAPESSWRPPARFLEPADILVVDVETRDPHLKSLGPGFKYGEGEVCGIVLATEREAQYLPFGHVGGDNLDKGLVVRVARDRIQRAKEVIMANATYDLGWLKTLGIEVPGVVRDVQVAEALIDEEKRTYSLDSLARKYLGKPKDETALKEAAEAFQIDPKADLYKLPARYVGAYGEADGYLPYRVYEKQREILKAEGLWDVWETECAITKICVKMTEKGVRVDLDAADRLNSDLMRREKELRSAYRFNINSSDQVGRWCEDELGIKVPRTEDGNYSVTKGFVASLGDKRLEALFELREIGRLRKTYVEENILRNHYRGRIHATFKQTRQEEGGTRSGRFSCASPNLQQVPKRSKIGKLIRALYVADEGRRWAKCDYNSQEPRLQVHYAILLGLDGTAGVVEAFARGEKMAKFFEKETGLPYDVCKALVLGISYGMGIPSLSDMIGRTPEDTQDVYDRFNLKAPFLGKLFDECKGKAARTGEIRTIMGRKSRFELFAPRWDRKSSPVKGYDKAREKWPGEPLERCNVKNAFNRLIQGSAADQTKRSMVLADEAGLDLRLQVHDENNINFEHEREARLLKEIMENAITLKLPVVGDLDIGDGWQ